ncbi:cellulose binding domain-containing protein [Actinoallomurus purpureus]|uniref:cellulose binding domain-containing protein n=1 Tax=Actinoallomurus purpureus TaxID=478114 RepID=UPI00209202F4|nr:cellulose binding domain-containing protein [Actinoallomurus purpureus]MCO6006282.1 cellulose binding domain-containing protein [Actinoallomurus purpureus]
MKRSRIASLIVGMLLLPLAVVLPAVSAYAAANTATFAKTSDWGSGYQAQFTVTNNGSSAISGWTVAFDLPSGSSVGTYWDALLTQSGSHYTFKNRDYNASIAAGASVTFGFVASGSGTPTGCTLNGAACGGGGGGSDTQAPSTPAGLAVTGHTSSSVSLSWTASTDNVGVTGYEVYQGSSLATTVSGTSATVSGLSASTSYTFKVRAKDAAGNLSAFSASVSATTDSSSGGGGSGVFSPYVDITMATPTLKDVATATGQKHFTLAFALGDSTGCNPSWGGTIALGDSRVIGEVNDLKGVGGDVTVATGGALGPYLENSCGSSSALLAAYKKALDAVGSNHIDVDVEASIPVAQVNTALKQLQSERGTTVTYTLRVQAQDYGVDPFSVQILQDAASRGLNVTVNPMLMDFGYSGSWGDALISAANATLGQMKQIWTGKSDAELKRMLGLTPMIGKNDTGPTTTQAVAGQLLSYAQSNHVGSIGFWSVGRDNGGCPNGSVSPTCSGISQSTYEFTNIFKAFTG